MTARRRVVGALLLVAAASCARTRTSLVDELDRAVKIAPEGSYAAFLDAPTDRGLVRLAEDSRPSITPPFPAAVQFELTLPDAAFLSFAPALVARTEVRRAQVEFLVRLEAEGESAPLFEELFDFEDVNRWHDREVDLSRWSGRSVTLTLETRAPGGRTGKLWADRIQTVWGEPVVASNRRAALVGSLGADAERVVPFAANLALGGLLGLAVRRLYLRFGSSVAERTSFGNLFPLFTLATILIVTVVQVSIPLSLGLLGALSIVRFRSAIKTPEELVYLLFCVAVGVALAAGHRLLAAVTVVLVAVFVLAHARLRGREPERTLLICLSGDASRFFGPGAALEALRPLVERLDLQRFDREGDRVELRTIVTVRGAAAESLLRRLREALPGLEIAALDADAMF